ncbi:MAG: CDP-glycerol glycerophosphotransferase family protein [Candidatus Binatia bacterium]
MRNDLGKVRFWRAAVASPLPWTSWAALHRLLHPGERRALDEALARRSPASRRIAISVAHEQFLEHVRDLWQALERASALAPLLVGPTWFPPRRYKTELFRFLGDRYGLAYGRDVLPHPWLAEAGVELLLELTVSRYGEGIAKVMYAHGMAGLGFTKDLADVRYLERYRAAFLTGPLHRRALAAAARLHGARLPELVDVGYLRGDRLRARARSFDRRGYLERLELEPVRPLVLYAPTWGAGSSLASWLDPLISITSRIGASLAVRLHPITLHDPRWSTRLAAIEASARHVRARPSHDLDDELLAADVIVSEASGLGVEFLTLGKPAVFLPAERYFELYGRERPEWWVRAQPEPGNESELARALGAAIGGARGPSAADDLVYNPGRALDVMLDAIRSLIG